MSLPLKTYPKDAWNAFGNVIDNCVPNFRGLSFVETYQEKAWNAFENVIDNGMSNSRAVGFVSLIGVPRKPTPKMHLEM